MTAAVRTNALTVMAPLAPRQLWLCRFRLPILRIVAMWSPLARLRFIHFAEWIVFRDLPGGGPGPRPRPGMLFLADFDGDLPEYLAAFGLVVPGGMKVSFGATEGFPGPQPTRGLIDYVDRHRTPELVQWWAHPGVTVRDVDATLAVAAALDRLGPRLRHRHRDPDAFAAAYRDLLAALARAPDPHVPTPREAITGLIRDALLRRRPGVAGLSLALPVAPGREADVAAAAATLGQDGSPLFSAVPGTHVARLALIGGEGTDHAGVWAPHLLVAARFDGRPDDYLRALVEAVGAGADDLWGPCAGYPGRTRPEALASWLDAHRLPASIFFPAADVPVGRIVAARDRQERALATITPLQGRPPEEIAEALRPLWEEP